MIGYGRGGGGSSSFPYRSAHQQGQDGGNRGGRGGRQIRKKTKARTPNNNNISIAAELDIPPNQRRLIVGRGAATLKWMKLVTGANIFVPHVQVQNRRGRRSNNNNQATDNSDDDSSTLPQQQADQHPVRVNSSDLSSVLHAFHEISNLLSRSKDIETTFIPCIVRMKTNNNIPNPPPLNGKLFIEEKSEDVESKCRCLFSSTLPSDDQSGNLYAYSIELSSTTLFDEESIGMIVDNILFIDSSLEKCHWYYKEIDKKSSDNADNDEDDSRRIVFIFGSNSDNIETFYEALKDGISAAEKSSQLPNENK